MRAQRLHIQIARRQGKSLKEESRTEIGRSLSRRSRSVYKLDHWTKSGINPDVSESRTRNWGMILTALRERVDRLAGENSQLRLDRRIAASETQRFTCRASSGTVQWHVVYAESQGSVHMVSRVVEAGAQHLYTREKLRSTGSFGRGGNIDCPSMEGRIFGK